MDIKFSLLIAFALVSGVLHSQKSDNWYKNEQNVRRWLAGMHLDWGIAAQQFARNLSNDNGWGLGGELLINIQKERPLWGGLGVHSFAFDRYSLQYSQEIDGQFYNYQDRTVSRLFMLQGLVRFQPDLRFFVQPYIQGAAGINWFYTNTKIRDIDYDEQVDRVNENRDAIWGFALQGGVHVVHDDLPDLRWDLRFAYYRNASVEYLRYNRALSGNFPIDSFEPKISPVDLLGIHIGLAVVLRPTQELVDDHE